MKRKGQRIDAIEPGSIGEELELEPGDILVSIDLLQFNIFTVSCLHISCI